MYSLHIKTKMATLKGKKIFVNKHVVFKNIPLHCLVKVDSCDHEPVFQYNLFLLNGRLVELNITVVNIPCEDSGEVVTLSTNGESRMTTSEGKIHFAGNFGSLPTPTLGRKRW